MEPNRLQPNAMHAITTRQAAEVLVERLILFSGGDEGAATEPALLGGTADRKRIK